MIEHISTNANDFYNWQTWCEKCHVSDAQALHNKLSEIYDFLIYVNASTNLTRITSPEGFWIKHVADSLLIGHYIDPRFLTGQTAWCDFGCGGGFPSLVLAAAYPDIEITAIDSIGKKTAFVEACALKYGLNNLKVVTGRGNELMRKSEFQNRFDILTARAVATPAKIILEAGKMVRRGRHVILYQTPEQATTEIENHFEKQTIGFSWKCTGNTSLPHEAGDRCFLIGTRN